MKFKRSFKDINKRKTYKNVELLQRVFKTVLFTFNNNYLKLLLLERYSNFKLEYFKSRITNFCIISGRPRSVIRKFKVSRILLRELSAKGCFFGLKKAS